MPIRWRSLALLCLVAAACGVSDPPPDAGSLDSGIAPDAGPAADAGPALDAGRAHDAGAPDAGPEQDAGSELDAGPGLDAGLPDAGPVDAGPADAGSESDAGPADAGAPDAGPADAGPVDAGGEEDAGPDAGPADAGPLVPDPPAFVTVQVNGNQLEVTWGAPVYSGAAPLDGYTVQVDAQVPVSVPAFPLAAELSPTLGVPHQISVRAQNAYGLSDPIVSPDTFTLGRFDPPVRLASGLAEYGNGMVVGDLNHDGRPDVVIVQDALYTLLGQDDGGLGPELVSPLPQYVRPATVSFTTPFALVDLDGDGHLDLVGSRTDAFGHGDGTFTQLVDACGTSTHPNAGDFFGDGHASLACITYSGELLVERFFPDGGSTTTGVPLPDAGFRQQDRNCFAVGDFDSDGHVDLFVSRPADTLLGDGDGGFTPQPSSDRFPSPEQSWFTLDLNQDGNLDAVNEEGDVALGDGTGLMAPPYYAHTELPIISVVDMDGDGWGDLQSARSGVIHLYFNLHDGGFSPGENYPVSALNQTVVYDMNGDGKPDLVTLSNPPPTFVHNVDVHYGR